VRTVGQVIIRIELAQHEVARLEIDECVGTGADRFQVGLCVTRLRPDKISEQMFGDHHAVDADKGVGPERRRLGEDHAHCVIVELLDLDVLVAADGDGGSIWIFRVLPVEHHIVGRERCAVVPFNALLQLPDDRQAVLFETVIVLARDFRSQHRHQVAITVPAGQRFIEHATGLLVFHPHREVRIEQCRRLPQQELQRAATAGFGRLVSDRGCGHRHARLAQHCAGQRGGEPHRDHVLHKSAARQAPGFDLVNQLAKIVLVHRSGSTVS
jgi:hypothetical protein